MIKVKLADLSKTSHIHGGSYCEPTQKIYIDKNLPYREQVRLLFHEFIELMMPLLDHDMIDNLESDFIECFDQLKKRKGE